MIKAILGYEIEEGMTPEEYERWLFEVHAPDLLANPHLNRIVFNKVLRPVRQASGGTVEIGEQPNLYRISEMYFADEDAYTRYLEWFRDHPIPAERGPAGRTAFRFYVLAAPTEVSRWSAPVVP
ncbi:EthD domain-containing protein [Pseudonocardia thermophila]|uniref:EthD domain-containing protein n=1 Tax=Pseudonocardia thermophila TaxID=1848 RepID=UPI00248ED7A0|nr:EthD domain-containing protein [Pseudonocardia thermophila]